MKNYFRLLVISAGIGAALGASAQTAKPSPADTDWLNLMDLIGPVAPSLVSPGQGQLNAPEIQQANQFENASQLAKAFYVAYPADLLASQARKLEVVMALQSVQLGDTQYEPQALALSSAYLGNTLNSAHDRFDVALATAPLSGPIQGASPAEAAAIYYESLADTLHTQFGDIPEVYSFYYGVMRTVGPADAVTVARNLLKMNAPATVKAEARKTLARAGLVGKPLSLTLTAVDGTVIDLSEPCPEPTVIYVWSNAFGTQDLTALAGFEAAIPWGARLIYLSLKSDLSAVKTAVGQLPVPGICCFEEPGLDGLTARTLGVFQTPCVYVLSKQGVLVGFGRVQDVGSLLGTANN